LIGLVEREWLETLSTINPEEVTYTDYVESGQALAKDLRSKGCQFIIALTHMRTPNDLRLAANANEIDLILGGHDHVYEKKLVNGTYVLKSGTDFRQFSVITVDFSTLETRPVVEIDSVDVTKDFEPDNELESLLEKYTDKMEVEMIKELGEFEADLEGRFSVIRTQETNLGNFVCDIMVASTNADLALLNSGSFRSDAVQPAGPFFLKDLLNILPMIDPLVLLEVTGPQLLKCLENGVSQYPKLEGRFPQVSGISFAFDPEKPSGMRVDATFVKIGDHYLDMDPKSKKKYRLVTKAYLGNGKDGYDVLANCKQLIDEENGPTLAYAVQNHFAALAMREGKTRRSSVHHQSLVTLSRQTSLVRKLTEDGSHHLPAHMPEKFHHTAEIAGSGQAGKLCKQATIGDLEATHLNPKVEGRIRLLNSKEEVVVTP
jgi:5'-nucleotidase